jgi:hypothetical protein
MGICSPTVWQCVRECIQKFPGWPHGARTAHGRVLCHKMQLYLYFVSQSSEFCCHDPLCCFSTSAYYCCLFRYRLSPETFGYTLVYYFHAIVTAVSMYKVCVCAHILSVIINQLHYFRRLGTNFLPLDTTFVLSNSLHQ